MDSKNSTCASENNKNFLPNTDYGKIFEEIVKANKKEWLIISPDGILYRGQASDLLPIIARDIQFFGNNINLIKE